jgi:3-deoxy-manno-octulosonate cytidylyltransferase (CMP-KDO synthetase)
MQVIIPARFQSSRLPGKALVDICGKPLIQWVYELACRTRASRVVIATDDERIRSAALGFGAEVCMTSDSHRSGTDRIAEALRTLSVDGDEVIVNLQGDEPLMPPALIDRVVDCLASHEQAAMATAAHPIEHESDYLDPNVVKVVTDSDGYALYFSRAAIPWHRDAMSAGTAPPAPGHRHIGLYVSRAAFIQRYTAWDPCPLEQAEALEQLRVLWHGERIAVCEAVEQAGPGVDTPADLERVRSLISGSTGD